MYRTLKRLGLGSPIIAASLCAPVVYCKEGPRPSDVYLEPKRECKTNPNEVTELEKCIAKCRTEIEPIKEGVAGFASSVSEFATESARAVGANVSYLRRAPQEVQIGAIFASTLLGSLLGFRRGLFRKVWYGTLGGASMAAVIFPTEAREVAWDGFQMVKCYGKVAYNFIAGPGAAPKNSNDQPKKRDC